MGKKENEKHQVEKGQEELDTGNQVSSHEKLASPSAMDVLEEEDAAAAATPGKIGDDGLTKIVSEVCVKQSDDDSADLKDTEKKIEPSAQEIGRQQSGVEDPKTSAAAAVSIPTDCSKKQSSLDAPPENYENNAFTSPLEEEEVEAPGGSSTNLGSPPPPLVSSTSHVGLVPFAASLLPPTTTSSLWETQKVPGAGGGGDGILKAVSGISREDEQHPEQMFSSPGSDAENSHPPHFLAPRLNFLTPMKELSVNGDKAAATTGEASLRHVLSDPITGTFMDDAVVARCGHTYGSASLIAVLETGKCIHCGTSVPADSLVPNFALRAAVHAFKQEDHVCEFTSMKAAKRKREQPEQQQQQPEGSDVKRLALDPHIAGEQASPLDCSRPKGVQFPFVVGDQVLIKGNKRTPERFVGKEAIITTQCLNGWYLVQTLDQGESVRLQYRSLQKLGEKDVQPDLEGGISADQVGSEEKHRKSSNPKEAVPSLPMTEEHPEGYAREASATMTVVFPIMPVKGIRTELHKKARKGDLTRSIDAAAASSMPSVGASSTSSPDMQSDVKTPNLSKVREETEVAEVVEDDPYDMKPVWTAPPLSEKVEALTDKTNGSDNGDKLLDLPQMWEGLKEPQGLQKPKEGREVGSGPIIAPNTEVGDTFTIRSKRSVLANRGPSSMSLSMESDPYRKVYSSGSRRRGNMGEAVVQERLAPIPIARKPLTKCTTKVGEKAGLKWVGRTGEKHIQEAVSIPNMNDILAIMQKDILGLEKQIPWNCLVKSWRMRRANWRKGVKQSSTVLELGTKVKIFRTGLLLTGAGGISDEEWEKRMGFAMESGDVELLVSLWGRLYDDVFKWVQSKAKHTHETVIDTNLVETFAELRKQFPQLQVAGLSPARITTAATLAAADAIAEHHIDANVSLGHDRQALLAVPMKLLQQHSREDLFALREALEREKRHLAAKLALLEENETFYREKEDLVAGFLATAQPSTSLDMTAPPTTLEAMLPMPGNFVREQRIQGDEMDEGESDAVDSTHDADGEATDMSDSD